ncbi:MAG: tripartite tricarboxylate transporter TctB family protein [Devosia sp.]
MDRYDLRDVIGGFAILLIGAFFAFNSMNYSLGTLQSMGAGLFPLILSVCFVAFGLAILIPAFFRSGDVIVVKLKDPAIVTASIVVFALVLDRVGVILAVIASILVVSLSVKLTWIWRVGLCVVVAASTYILFVRLLGMNIPVWPRFN